MNPTELIRKKRGGEALTPEELRALVEGYLAGTIPDYQMSALLMAVVFRGMTFEETAALTGIMLHSGVSVDLSSVPGTKVDKHSTGGVGDKVSLILAPMVAACGVPVPMISGRGLGHTGGTLDKLESIPGFRTSLSLEEYKRVIGQHGLVMIGQTAEIAPADRKLYALRDVTATVESIPLIAASIMSKKLAEGIDALVLDVKSGRGAFMETEEQALALARTLIEVGAKFGKKTVAVMTDMSQPLGYAVGNWLEVRECVACLRGAEVPGLSEVTVALGGVMLKLGGKAETIEEGMDLCRNALRDGRAWRKFLALVVAQGGDVSALEHDDRYPASRCIHSVAAPASGTVSEIDALEIGYAAVSLGAGRMKVDDVMDPKSGIVLRKRIGDAVAAGETLATIYTDRSDVVAEAAARITRAFRISTGIVRPPALVKTLIDESGAHPWTN